MQTKLSLEKTAPLVMNMKETESTVDIARDDGCRLLWRMICVQSQQASQSSGVASKDGEEMYF